MRCGRRREGLQNPRLSSQEKTHEGHPRYRHSGNRQILPCHCSWEGGGVTKPWLRLYRKIVESKKIHDLRPELFKPWVLLLACTDDDGNFPPLEQLSFKRGRPA